MGNRALDGANKKGREARQEGKPKTSCPYRDKRGEYRGSVTFSRAFIGEWMDGWDFEDKRIKGEE